MLVMLDVLLAAWWTAQSIRGESELVFTACCDQVGGVGYLRDSKLVYWIWRPRS